MSENSLFYLQLTSCVLVEPPFSTETRFIQIITMLPTFKANLIKFIKETLNWLLMRFKTLAPNLSRRNVLFYVLNPFGELTSENLVPYSCTFKLTFRLKFKLKFHSTLLSRDRAGVSNSRTQHTFPMALY